MFEQMEGLEAHYQEIQNSLADPAVTEDANRYRKLMKEENDLLPIISKYKEYKSALQTQADSLEIIDNEPDEEMKQMAREDLASAKKKMRKIWQRSLQYCLYQRIRMMIRI